jgi:hypothetical protein
MAAVGRGGTRCAESGRRSPLPGPRRAHGPPVASPYTPVSAAQGLPTLTSTSTADQSLPHSTPCEGRRPPGLRLLSPSNLNWLEEIPQMGDAPAPSVGSEWHFGSTPLLIRKESDVSSRWFGYDLPGVPREETPRSLRPPERAGRGELSPRRFRGALPGLREARTGARRVRARAVRTPCLARGPSVTPPECRARRVGARWAMTKGAFYAFDT